MPGVNAATLEEGWPVQADHLVLLAVAVPQLPVLEPTGQCTIVGAFFNGIIWFRFLKTLKWKAIFSDINI